MSAIKQPKPTACPACGVQFEDHLGLIETCKRLDEAQRALRVIQTWATCNDGEGLDPKHTAALCMEVLTGPEPAAGKRRKR